MTADWQCGWLGRLQMKCKYTFVVFFFVFFVYRGACLAMKVVFDWVTYGDVKKKFNFFVIKTTQNRIEKQ